MQGQNIQDADFTRTARVIGMLLAVGVLVSGLLILAYSCGASGLWKSAITSGGFLLTQALLLYGLWPTLRRP